MITTNFVPGSPSWLDLGAPDIDAAAAFYGGVFGWEYSPAGPEAQGYGAFQLDGKSVAAVGPLTEEGAMSAWMIYFTTSDAQATARAVQAAGGTVRVPPTDIGDEGFFAQFSDPDGGQFAVFEPGRQQGFQAVDAPGTLVWTELCTTNAAGAKEFYGSVFGWQTEDMPMPGGGGAYTLIAPAGEAKERQHGGIAQLAPEHLAQTNGTRPYWHPVFGSADCDATAAAVGMHGGKVLMGPEDMEDVGRLAVCHDPAGAEFVILTAAES